MGDGAALHPVGRLDRNTTGLLLLCADGELTYLMLRPGFLAKTYVGGTTRTEPPTAAQLQRLQSGVVLNDGPAKAEAVRLLGSEIVPLPAHLQGTVPQSRRYDVRRVALYPHVSTVGRVRRTHTH
jgi:23S rRNA pseudouridine2605 synthase